MTLEFAIKVLRGGAELDRLIFDAESAPTVRFDSKAAIKCSLQGQFWPSTVVELLKDELQAALIIDGVETPLGIFRVTTCRATGNSSGRRWDLQAYDRTWLVQSKKTESRLHFDAGTAYIVAIESLLTACGIGLVLKTDSTATLPAAAEYETGTDYLTIINGLLAEISYRKLYFDAAGYAHIEPYRQPSADKISRQYSATDIRRIGITPDYSESTDIFDKANVFICICANADNDTTLVATAVNDSPLSPQSTFSRGLRLAEIIKVNQIAGQAELQAYADKLKYQSMQNTAEITFYTLPGAVAMPGTVIAIDHPEIGGIYEETGWSLDLKAGALMTHTAKRAVIV